MTTHPRTVRVTREAYYYDRARVCRGIERSTGGRIVSTHLKNLADPDRLEEQ
jgi:hypothetical protein